ncbi:hypothetical protein GALMADRAFT_66282 [Galerina marginata CBS 339.88]|uniref:Uncharacterized protein n=1 Tax=Galerina marginata (strain CBS 339.88) TaxID=685588 RepID=A0A067T4E6_GALM3|nr:hypothetical protein GALMADRAFT_66282 [Galerina marginata CBS 339.88]
MEALPLDLSHPSVKFYLALVRLQVLTPLSLLINIATTLICTLVANPSIAGVAHLYPTSLTPNSHAISAYVGLIWLAQVGYCVLLVVARKEETKKAMVSAVGLGLVFANVVMALWAVAFIMQWFLLSTILLGVLLALLIFSNLALLIYHGPDSSRPLDTALIHAPLRFFLILPLNILFPLTLFIALNLSYIPTPSGPPRDPAEYHSTAALGVLLGTNILGFLVIVTRRDIVWCVAATWISVSLWTALPKPASVYITSITFTALHPLGLIIASIYARFYTQPTRIALTGDDRRIYANGSRPSGAHPPEQEIERGPAEIEEENWG